MNTFATSAFMLRWLYREDLKNMDFIRKRVASVCVGIERNEKSEFDKKSKQNRH